MIRAEAGHGDFYSALDVALAKLDNRLRRSADRRRIHRGRRAPVSVAAATAGLDPLARTDGALSGVNTSDAGDALAGASDQQGSEIPDDQDEYEGLPGRVVRTKQHPAEPMTVDDALFQMELVGHDFYLFMDKESGQPTVVYRRHAYDYGVITLTR